MDGCPNCGSAQLDAYCASCGQPRPVAVDYSLAALARAIFDELTNYDGRVWGTARALLSRPGYLTREHYEGRRARYLSPFRIFVIANVSAWLAIPYLKIRGFELQLAREGAVFKALIPWALEARAASKELTASQLSARIEALQGTENALAVLCMTPLFASGVAVVLAGRGYRFVQHLVFTVHFYCIHLFCILVFWGLVLSPLYGFLKAQPELPPFAWAAALFTNLWTQHLFVAPALFPYLYGALKQAYLLSPSQAAWRAVLLTVWACTVARAFLDVAFVVSLFNA